MAFAAVSPAEAAIDPSATFSLSFMIVSRADGLASAHRSVNEAYSAYLDGSPELHVVPLVVRCKSVRGSAVRLMHLNGWSREEARGHATIQDSCRQIVAKQRP